MSILCFLDQNTLNKSNLNIDTVKTVFHLFSFHFYESLIYILQILCLLFLHSLPIFVASTPPAKALELVHQGAR